MKHLITGATGNIGSLVVLRLLERGERPRVFVRDADKAHRLFGDRVEVAVGDLTDKASLATAMTGIDRVFLVTSGHELARLDALAADVAKAAHVQRLVKLSSIDARQQNVGTGVWHASGEAAIRASGVEFTFLQPSGFMSNALYWARGIKSEGMVRSATGDGRIAFIHPADIAAVSHAAMLAVEWGGKSLPITGPEALSYAEMTANIGAAIGRPLRYEEISEEEARQQQMGWNARAPMIEARLSIFRAIRAGLLEEVTDTVERVLGRKPHRFDRWVTEEAAAFR